MSRLGCVLKSCTVSTHRNSPRVSAKASKSKNKGRPASRRAKNEFDDGQPRYLQIARELKRSIADGSYPVGARLPTELELCEQFGISRFTARAAVRILSSAGLVVRRQRVGTVVVATPDDARYSHDAASLRDLLQYAQDTELRLIYIGKVALTKAQAREFGVKAGEEWIYAVGMRHGAKTNGHGDRPFCLTRLYLNPVLKGIETRLRARKTRGVCTDRERVQDSDRARRAGFSGRSARCRRCRQFGSTGRRTRASHRAPLLQRRRQAARIGRQRASERPVHVPDAVAQVAAPRSAGAVGKLVSKSPIDIRFGSIYIVRTNRPKETWMTANRTLIRRLVCAVTALWLGASVMPAAAQADYPNKPVRMLIGFPPGQATDTLGRAIAQKLSAAAWPAVRRRKQARRRRHHRDSGRDVFAGRRVHVAGEL